MNWMLGCGETTGSQCARSRLQGECVRGGRNVYVLSSREIVYSLRRVDLNLIPNSASTFIPSRSARCLKRSSLVQDTPSRGSVPNPSAGSSFEEEDWNIPIDPSTPDKKTLAYGVDYSPCLKPSDVCNSRRKGKKLLEYLVRKMPSRESAPVRGKPLDRLVMRNNALITMDLTDLDPFESSGEKFGGKTPCSSPTNDDKEDQKSVFKDHYQRQSYRKTHDRRNEFKSHSPLKAEDKWGSPMGASMSEMKVLAPEVNYSSRSKPSDIGNYQRRGKNSSELLVQNTLPRESVPNPNVGSWVVPTRSSRPVDRLAIRNHALSLDLTGLDPFENSGQTFGGKTPCTSPTKDDEENQKSVVQSRHRRQSDKKTHGCRNKSDSQLREDDGDSVRTIESEKKALALEGDDSLKRVLKPARTPSPLTPYWKATPKPISRQRRVETPPEPLVRKALKAHFAQTQHGAAFLERNAQREIARAESAERVCKLSEKKEKRWERQDFLSSSFPSWQIAEVDNEDTYSEEPVGVMSSFSLQLGMRDEDEDEDLRCPRWSVVFRQDPFGE